MKLSRVGATLAVLLMFSLLLIALPRAGPQNEASCEVAVVTITNQDVVVQPILVALSYNHRQHQTVSPTIQRNGTTTTTVRNRYGGLDTMRAQPEPVLLR